MRRPQISKLREGDSEELRTRKRHINIHFFRETLCESGRWIDALKKRGRLLKKRGRVLKKRGRFLRRGV